MTPERLNQIEALFHAARDRDANDREDFLAEACGDDVALRREVESLLQQPEGLLEKEGIAGILATLAAEGPEVLTGQRWGSYIVGPLLGAGGMGEVYRARDTRLRRDVALKILPRIFSHYPDRLARFEREARVLATLSHPHIAAIYGLEERDRSLGSAQTRLPALVLELVEGPTLAERLAVGPLPVPEALVYATQI